jgi:mannose/fructose/N-acetylgalactosamine-specific phosphotransferase system component IID
MTNPGRAPVVGWLALFLVLPLSVWLTAALRSGFREKSLSNLSMEPLMVAIFSVVVFFAWFLLARKGLRPLVGIILLVVLSAAALAVHRFVPGLRE